MRPPPVVDVAELEFRHGAGADAFTLRVPRLTIHSGEHTAIVGASGCGKTTLLRLVVGSLTADAGRITLLGADLGALAPAARRRLRLREVGMVFQSFALLDYLTATGNILLPYTLDASMRLTRDARARAAELAQAVGIAHTLKRKPARLSQGERQRVAICRALVTQPRVIVCDEPTGNLDPARAGAAIDLILREAAGIGATVLLVTHDHDLLNRFGRVVRLDGGLA